MAPMDAKVAETAIAALSDRPALSLAALLRGKELLAPLEGWEVGKVDASHESFQEAWSMFVLALAANPANAEAKTLLESMQKSQKHDHSHHHHSAAPDRVLRRPLATTHSFPLDVVVVGAGCSGVGVGFALTQVFGLDPDRVLLVERGTVGETFKRWPKEMRFISPSFNSQGWTESFDLNSVAYSTSPAFMLHAEHPTGDQYAKYLDFIASFSGLNVRSGTDVTAVRPLEGDEPGFDVEVCPAAGGVPTVLKTRYVIWAAGEFQYPRAAEEPLFPGSELCLHNSSVRSWKELPGDNFVVVGGYESGMDAASNLATCGKQCTVVSSTAYWNVTTADPSAELAPFTGERMRAAAATKVPPRLLAPLRVTAVEADQDTGGFVVKATWGPEVAHENCALREPMTKPINWRPKHGGEVSLKTPQPPVLCAGFLGSVKQGAVKDLFDWVAPDADDEPADDDEDDKPEFDLADADEGDAKPASGCAAGSPLLNEVDESTKVPGLFLVGPAVRHGKLSFCFVYKFRQRFGVVADAIARGLGRDTADAVAQCRKTNMFLDDFECCEGSCQVGC